MLHSEQSYSKDNFVAELDDCLHLDDDQNYDESDSFDDCHH